MASRSHQPVERRVADALDGETLATVESCTGGLIGSRLTDVPGSSTYFDRGFVTYSNDAKLELGVSRESLDEDGAVSEAVAREMAQAGRDVAGTTWCVSTTGIAGPAGGTEDKPVGTVYVGVAYAGPWGTSRSNTRVRRQNYEGTRTEIKAQIATGALELLIEAIEDW
ncbi:MAG: CinA family protein [Halodesulfurarchaeum sp.]